MKLDLSCLNWLADLVFNTYYVEYKRCVVTRSIKGKRRLATGNEKASDGRRISVRVWVGEGSSAQTPLCGRMICGTDGLYCRINNGLLHCLINFIIYVFIQYLSVWRVAEFWQRASLSSTHSIYHHLFVLLLLSLLFFLCVWC